MPWPGQLAPHPSLENLTELFFEMSLFFVLNKLGAYSFLPDRIHFYWIVLEI